MDDPTLAERFERFAAQVASAWPALRIDAARLTQLIARKMQGAADPLAVLDSMRAADLYLAACCAAGDEDALRIFDPILCFEVDAAAASVRAPRPLADEATQRLRASLLVGDAEHGPRIADYAGLGDLRGFLRVSAVRECLRVRREQERDHGRGPDVLDALAQEGDPELQRLKDTYRADFAACFAQAIESLDARARTLLRHHTLDRMSIDALGALHGVHRATAARWLEQARRHVAARTEALLAKRLSLSEQEAESIVRLVQSQLDVSLRGLLATRVEDRPT